MNSSEFYCCAVVCCKLCRNFIFTMCNSWMFLPTVIFKWYFQKFHPLIFCVSYIQYWAFILYCNCHSVLKSYFERSEFCTEIYAWILHLLSKIWIINRHVPYATNSFSCWRRVDRERISQIAWTVLSYLGNKASVWLI